MPSFLACKHYQFIEFRRFININIAIIIYLPNPANGLPKLNAPSPRPPPN